MAPLRWPVTGDTLRPTVSLHNQVAGHPRQRAPAVATNPEEVGDMPNVRDGVNELDDETAPAMSDCPCGSHLGGSAS